MISKSLVFSRILMLLSVTLLTCGASPQSTHHSDNGQIVVNAKTEKRLHEIVKDLTPANSGQHVGRWHQQVCVQVTGADVLHSKIIKDIFAAHARRLGISIASRPDCIANVSIAIASNADDIAHEIAKTENWLLVDPKEGDPPRFWRDAVTKPNPVRWFVANRTTLIEGGSRALSRIKLQSEANFVYSYILLDPNKLTGITWRRLADFVTFVALVGPTPGGTAPSDSILSIFSERDAGRVGPMALTFTDEIFLDALYATDSSFPPGLERRDIERRMKAGGVGAAP